MGLRGGILMLKGTPANIKRLVCGSVPCRHKESFSARQTHLKHFDSKGIKPIYFYKVGMFPPMELEGSRWSSGATSYHSVKSMPSYYRPLLRLPSVHTDGNTQSFSQKAHRR